MIRVRFPASDPFYTVAGFGPFYTGYEDDLIRNSSDFLQEKPGFYGENHCLHRKTYGTVVVHTTRPLSSSYKTDKKYYVPQIRLNGSVGSNFIVDGFYLRPSTPWKVGFDYSPGGQNWYYFTKKVSPTYMIKYQLAFHRSSRKIDRFFKTETSVSDGASDILSTLVTREYQLVGGDIFVPLYQGRMPNSLSETQALLSEFLNLVNSTEIPFRSQGISQTHTSRLRPNFVSASRNYSPLFNFLNGVVDYQFPGIDYPDPGDLAKDAIETLDRNSINMFEFLQGLKKPWELLPKLKNLGTLKNLSENYLTTQYGILPTVDDLKEIFDLFVGSPPVEYRDRNNFLSLTAGRSVSNSNFYSTRNVTARIKLGYDDRNYFANTLSERLRDIGAFPSVDNLWELIPFSFVIDWFVNVGDFLDSLDNNFRGLTLPIKYCTSSRKDVTEVEIGLIPNIADLSGTISFSLYERNVSRYAPATPLDFEVSNELPNHWLEAGALIVANRK